jgi:hypothetical protein
MFILQEGICLIHDGYNPVRSCISNAALAFLNDQRLPLICFLLPQLAMEV